MFIPKNVIEKYSKPVIGSVVRTQGGEPAKVQFTLDRGRAYCAIAIRDGDLISKDKFTDPYWQIKTKGVGGLKLFLSEGDSRRLRENPKETVKAVKIIARSKSGKCVFGVTV